MISNSRFEQRHDTPVFQRSNLSCVESCLAMYFYFLRLKKSPQKFLVTKVIQLTSENMIAGAEL